jgi:hypothetical protein
MPGKTAQFDVKLRHDATDLELWTTAKEPDRATERRAAQQVRLVAGP